MFTLCHADDSDSEGDIAPNPEKKIGTGYKKWERQDRIMAGKNMGEKQTNLLADSIHFFQVTFSFILLSC